MLKKKRNFWRTNYSCELFQTNSKQKTRQLNDTSPKEKLPNQGKLRWILGWFMNWEAFPVEHSEMQDLKKQRFVLDFWHSLATVIHGLHQHSDLWNFATILFACSDDKHHRRNCIPFVGWRGGGSFLQTSMFGCNSKTKGAAIFSWMGGVSNRDFFKDLEPPPFDENSFSLTFSGRELLLGSPDWRTTTDTGSKDRCHSTWKRNNSEGTWMWYFAVKFQESFLSPTFLCNWKSFSTECEKEMTNSASFPGSDRLHGTLNWERQVHPWQQITLSTWYSHLDQIQRSSSIIFYGLKKKKKPAAHVHNHNCTDLTYFLHTSVAFLASPGASIWHMHKGKNLQEIYTPRFLYISLCCSMFCTERSVNTR